MIRIYNENANDRKHRSLAIHMPVSIMNNTVLIFLNFPVIGYSVR